MNDLLLTHEEIKDLTEYQSAAKQSKWFSERGIPFEVGAKGNLKVARATILHHLGFHVKNTTKKWQLDPQRLANL